MAIHRAKAYFSLEQFIGSDNDNHRWIRYRTAIWNKHVARNGNVPIVEQCDVCSGEEYKRCWKKSRPSKRLRDEEKFE